MHMCVSLYRRHGGCMYIQSAQISQLSWVEGKESCCVEGTEGCIHLFNELDDLLI